jgi:Recombinase
MGSERLAEIRQSSPRGRSCGSTPETRGRGPLAHFLRNRFYIGEIVFKGEVLPGEQPAILDRELFDAVQAKLNEQRTHHTVVRGQSEALLIGRIYDDRGNRMSPSHVRKGGIKYRYYLSSPLLHGRPERACTVRRVPATEVEALVGSAVREHADQLVGRRHPAIRSGDKAFTLGDFRKMQGGGNHDLAKRNSRFASNYVVGLA